MAVPGFLFVLALASGRVPVQDPSEAVLEQVRGVLGRAALKLGTEFQPLADDPHSFVAGVSRALQTCDRIELEVDVREGGQVEVRAYPRVRGARLDPRNATDRPGLLAKLGAANPAIAPLAWAAEAEAPVHAVHAVRWSDTSAVEVLERSLLAVPAVDKAVANLLTVFPPPLTEEQIDARLRAAAADPAERAEILAGIAGYLPEVLASAIPGKSAFGKLALNRRGAKLDAFRFQVPSEGGERRLVWAFAYPPGTAKAWSIVPLSGDAAKFVKFHQVKLKGTDLPAGHATIVQRTETPLRPGAEYLIWFELKVETPVDLYVALGCFPFVKSDRDTPAALTEALGLTPAR